MRELDRALTFRAEGESVREGVDEYPLPVAENWEDLVARSERAAEVIDRHLEFESRLQGRELRPITLCPEQKVSLASDLAVV